MMFLRWIKKTYIVVARLSRVVSRTWSSYRTLGRMSLRAVVTECVLGVFFFFLILHSLCMCKSLVRSWLMVVGKLGLCSMFDARLEKMKLWSWEGSVHS